MGPFLCGHFYNTCNSIQVYPLCLVNSLAQIEDESFPERVGYPHSLQDSKRLKLVSGNNDKIYTHSF
jgi:hypothetical protein